MCEDAMVDATKAPALPAPVEAKVEALQAAVEAIQRELVALRMSQRKALLEELAGLERPLVEQGVLSQRTRPPRHRGDPEGGTGR